MDPGRSQEVAQPHVTVLRHEAVRPRGEGGGVQLKQRGQVVAVRDGDKVVHGLARVTACKMIMLVTSFIFVDTSRLKCCQLNGDMIACDANRYSEINLGSNLSLQVSSR